MIARILILTFLFSFNLQAKEGMSYIEFTMRQQEKLKYQNLDNYKKNLKDKTVVQKVSLKKAAPSQIQNTYTPPNIYKVGEALSLNYYVEYNGPSLSDSYQDGATYNRYNTGQDIFGKAMDATGSHQTYHALTIGYQTSINTRIFYGYTFQENLNSDIEYQTNNSDGSTNTYTRSKGPSDNNKRIGLSVFNIIDNQYINFSNNHYYEISSTYGSETEEMMFGLGVQPTLSFKNNISGLYLGLTGEIQRNFFKEREVYPSCGDIDCPIPNRYQTLYVQVQPMANYKINDIVTLKSTLKFDWDQRGNQVDSTKDFNRNMDDIARVGADFYLGYGITAGTHLEFSIEDPEIEKTMLGASLNMNLF